MKKTVAKITHKGTYRVVFDDSANGDPYTIYKEFYAGGNKHKLIVARYPDMTKCLYHIAMECDVYDRV